LLGLQYIGLGKRTDQAMELLNTNAHVILLDKESRKKYKKYLDLYSVPGSEQLKDSFYKEYSKKHWNLLKTNVTKLKIERSLARKMLQLFNDDVSPGLVDDSILRQYPATFIKLCTLDGLRDEQFIFLERMRRLGVNVKHALLQCPHSGDEKLIIGVASFWEFFQQELHL
jgi:acetyl esterase/lipase